MVRRAVHVALLVLLTAVAVQAQGIRVMTSGAIVRRAA